MKKSYRLSNIVFEGIDHSDAPDYCDAYIVSAEWTETGVQLTDDELYELNNDSDLVYELLMNKLY